MTCCFLLVSEKVFPGKSSLFPEMHHVWENVLNGALMVGDEATFGFQQHVNSSFSTGKSIAGFTFVPTEAARRWCWVFFFSLSLIAGRPLKAGFMEWATIYHSLQAASHFFSAIMWAFNPSPRVTKCFRAQVWHGQTIKDEYESHSLVWHKYMSSHKDNVKKKRLSFSAS